MKNPFAVVFRFMKMPAAIGLVGSVGIVLGIVFWGGFNTVLEATNNVEFCVSCHEMRDTVYQEYKTSVHFRNPSGVQAGCPDCHVPREWSAKILRKMQATNELYHKVMGTIDTPEKFDGKRLELAKHEWSRMKANNSQECRNCHSFGAMDFDHQRPKAAKMMQKAMAEGGTCIDCHKGIAHKLPDMTSGFRAMFGDLKGRSAADAAKADTLFALSTTGVWSSEDSARTGDKPDGRVLPGAPLKVEARDGDLLRVSLTGWQREGAERLVVAQAGKRIIQAALNEAFAQTATVHETTVDQDTDQTWKRVSLTAWLPAANLVASQQALWDYGAEMYTSSCGSCHSVPEATHFVANQWTGILNDMKDNTGLSQEELRFLESYLQRHAKDIAGHS